ncbi:MAG: ribonuclease H-like domain-containing protein [Planctomycetota bacterium]
MNADENAQRVVTAEQLSDLAPTNHAWDCYARLLSWKELKTRQNKPFLVVELADLDTVIEAKCWDNTPEAMQSVRELALQTPVKVRGRVTEYQGRAQLIIEQLRPVDRERDEQFDMARLIDPALELVEDLVCRTLVIDIETVPAFERRDLPESVADALETFARRKEPSATKDVVEAQEKKLMGMSPLFGKVVSLAVGDGDAEPGSPQDEVTVLAVPPEGRPIEDPPRWLRPMSEADLLRAFWALASRAEVVVTFNGRGFDIPFLVTRSLIHGIPARRDLLSNRFSLKPHLDLFEILTQRGNGPSKLDVVCWALGIESPKGAMDGSQVAPAYQKGLIREIAEYNAHDVRATSAVYRKVRDMVLRFRADWS